jgi:hypothetical protein
MLLGAHSARKAGPRHSESQRVLLSIAVYCDCISLVQVRKRTLLHNHAVKVLLPPAVGAKIVPMPFASRMLGMIHGTALYLAARALAGIRKALEALPAAIEGLAAGKGGEGRDHDLELGKQQAADMQAIQAT